jgi:hypothetical protein
MAADSDSPTLAFFVLGSPRSGTTLLRLMLTSHPHLAVPPECGYIQWLYPRFGHWTATEFSRPDARRSFASAVLECRKFDGWRLGAPALELTLRDPSVVDYASACASIHRQHARQHGKPRALLGDKNNYYLQHIELLHRLYPTARFLHIVRDGRDVLCSYREVMASQSASPYRPKLPQSVESVASAWREDLQHISSALAWLPKGQLMELRYEDLCTQPQTTLEPVCAHLGVPYSRDLLDFHWHNKRLGLEPRELLGWKARTLAPLSRETIGRHLTMLSAEERARFAVRAAEPLRRYGYTTG